METDGPANAPDSRGTRTLLACLAVFICGCGSLELLHLRDHRDSVSTQDTQDERVVFECEVVRGKVRCPISWHGKRDRTERFRLRTTRRDLASYGVVVVGWDVCAISTRWGFHCVHLGSEEEARAIRARPLTDRAWFSWSQGLCVESERVEGKSLFECFHREGGVRQHVEFWVASKHDIATFDEGACICSDTHGLGRGWSLPVGAACFFREDPVPDERWSARRADTLTRGVIMRGPGDAGDFAEVCGSLEGKNPDDALAQVRKWASEEAALPPSADSDDPGEIDWIEIPGPRAGKE